MILIKAQLTIQSESRTNFAHHMQVLVQASLAEAGCLSFGCFENVFAPNSFIVLGEWRDLFALEEHEQSAHVAAFKANAAPLIATRRETVVYTVSETSTLPLSPIKAGRAATR